MRCKSLFLGEGVEVRFVFVEWNVGLKRNFGLHSDGRYKGGSSIA